MIASEGKLTVLIPDLYHGTVTAVYEEAANLMAHLDWMVALKDIAAAAKFLKSKGCTKVSLDLVWQ